MLIAEAVFDIPAEDIANAAQLEGDETVDIVEHPAAGDVAGHDPGADAWEATDGHFERGLISDPKSKAKSVALTNEGASLLEELFTEMFGMHHSGSA